MSLHLAARHLAAQGRGPDTELVHMGKGEVQALQHLAHASGGALTTNPHTGLPEAGWLTSLLPMIAGAALAPMTAGTSLAFLGASPLYTGLAVGGLKGLASGNVMQGVNAGLSAFGGAGIGSALSSMGTNAAASLSPEAAQAVGQAAMPPAATSMSSAADLASQYAKGQTALANAMAANQPNVAAAAASPFQTMLSGANIAANNPGAFVDALGPHAARTGLMAAAPLIAGAMEPKKPKAAPIDSNPGPVPTFSYGAVSPFPTPSSTGVEQRYSNPRYNYAAGGIADGYSSNESHLGSYSDGGRLLRGPGDGVSDSIPATIGGKQPARLADGEFVIPARIVSELGNGSTEAGAKQLYAMMDRIQRARRKTTGVKQVAVKTNAQKLMPA